MGFSTRDRRVGYSRRELPACGGEVHGWVNWSGLASSLSETGAALAELVAWGQAFTGDEAYSARKAVTCGSTTSLLRKALMCPWPGMRNRVPLGIKAAASEVSSPGSSSSPVRN